MNIWFTIYLLLMTIGITLDIVDKNLTKGRIIGVIILVLIVYLAIKTGF